MKEAVLIYNPASGRQRSLRRLPELLSLLAEAGYRAEPVLDLPSPVKLRSMSLRPGA